MAEQTFMFCDLAGFTSMTEAMGDEEAVDVVSDYTTRTRAILGDHGASEVKAIGDALMLRVPDAAEAVRLGLRMADEVGGRHGFLGVRVGADHGEAIERGGDWFGRTVNVAARLAALASAGEVLVTGDLRRAAGELEGIEWVAHGEQELRNVAEAVPVFQATSTEANAQELPLDPVCRMSVDPAHAAGRLAHGGRRYLFCSLACAGKFAADPERYVQAAESAG